jgi:hypothetical protein
MPITGDATIMTASTGSKHLHFSRVGNRWYKVCGDHLRQTADSWSIDGGRQEIYSFRPLDNDWRRDQEFWVRVNGQVQLHQPDDAFSVAVGNEIWVFVSVRNPTNEEGTAVESAGYASGPHATPLAKSLMAWNPATGVWREIRGFTAMDQPGANPPELWRSGRAWFGTYDPQRNQIIIACNASGTKGYVVSTAPANEGMDISRRTAFGVVYNLVGENAVGAWAKDPATNYMYGFGYLSGTLYRIDLSNWALTTVRVLPNESDGSGMPRRSHVLWHDQLRAVVIAGRQWNVYEVDTGVLSQFPREDRIFDSDGTPCFSSTQFYDPEINAVCAVGCKTWVGSVKPPDLWWKQTFTRN